MNRKDDRQVEEENIFCGEKNHVFRVYVVSCDGSCFRWTGMVESYHRCDYSGVIMVVGRSIAILEGEKSMCSVMLKIPCDSRCPNAPEQQPVMICAECKEGIYEGDEYFKSCPWFVKNVWMEKT